MIASVEIVTCLAAIAVSAKLAKSEYIRMRKSRQLRQAARLLLRHPALQS